jgi:hypothetical protein
MNRISDVNAAARRSMVRILVTVGLTGGLGMASALPQNSPSRAPAAGGVQIITLSSRPDMVSGGDALIQVKAPAGTTLSDVTFTLNGRDVTQQLTPGPESGSFVGLVAGMTVGANKLTAAVKGPKKLQASLAVTNYAITGPILSGPHLTPYECRTVESGLGEPLDADCSAAQKTEYFYRTSGRAFKPLKDPAGPRPSDLEATTTNDGKTVPYIVRVESGTVNRTIYRIAVLDDPQAQKQAWTPGSAWNRKLAVAFGGGSGTQYNQGVNQATAVLNDIYLSRGFAYMISTELVNQLHSNAVLQGETLMMLKEYFIKHYGVPKWTVGFGGSGGAIQQLLITEMYPGLLDGLQPSLSFPDSTMQTADSGLLQNFWKTADPNVWTEAKKTAVAGYTSGTTGAWERSFVPVAFAANAKGCALNDASKIYDPVKNPRGTRCTTQEMRSNIYGRDPKTGFARKTQDNIGVQYGLAALNNGAISVDEFLELNAKIGGNDIDGNFVPQRVSGDSAAIRAAYRSGLVNSGGGGLGNVPILHSRAYADMQGDIHDRERDFTIRERLNRANGRSDNQVIWIAARGENYQTKNVDLASLSLDAMNRWLDNMAADPAPLSADKVVRNKPAEAVDTCWDSDGNRIVEPASFDGNGKCNVLYPVHSEPRLVAGAPLTNDVLKCELKPVSYADYKVSFTSTQKTRLAGIFPSGVCDYAKPGMDHEKLKGAYQRY